MSRIGKLPVTVANNVKVDLNGQVLSVTGPQGTLSREFLVDVELAVQEGAIIVRPRTQTKRARSLWGLSRTLVHNMVKGVSEGYSKTLEITGVGYKASVSGDLLTLFLGYSHDIVYALPKGIKVECTKPTTIVISGSDKELVGLIAAEIRQLRKPEPYKGKGVRYSDEVVRRKEGKKK